jgi:hypothetical protein
LLLLLRCVVRTCSQPAPPLACNTGGKRTITPF